MKTTCAAFDSVHFTSITTLKHETMLATTRATYAPHIVGWRTVVALKYVRIVVLGLSHVVACRRLAACKGSRRSDKAASTVIFSGVMVLFVLLASVDSI